MTESYGLDIQHASLLMGQCVRYDLGNIFDPAYTMVQDAQEALGGLEVA